MTVLDWLLDSDPAIRWQVLRDLVRAPSEVITAERARVDSEGWGARLLALQGEDGQWAGGACFPAQSFNWRKEGQPWTATLPTLQLLRDFGVDPCSNRARQGSTLRSRTAMVGPAGGTPCGRYASSAGTSRPPPEPRSRAAHVKAASRKAWNRRVRSLSW